MRILRAGLLAVLSAATAAAAVRPPAPIEARHPEGVVHGFLTLAGADGKALADGDSIQFSRGDRVTNRLVFRFRDGSLQEETTVFRQGRTFELLTDRLVQRGPSFPHPTEATIDRAAGRVTVRTTEKDGKPRTIDVRMALPPDLSNGLVPVLLKNLAPGAGETTLNYLATTPKPLLVQLQVVPEGEDSMAVGNVTHRLTRYRVHLRIPGIRGILAKAVGKQPPDTRIWILGGDAPTFVRSEGPAYLGGPVWTIQLVGPGVPKGRR